MEPSERKVEVDIVRGRMALGVVTKRWCLMVSNLVNPWMFQSRRFMTSILTSVFSTSLPGPFCSGIATPSSESLARSMYSLPSAVFATFAGLVLVVVELRSLLSFDFASDFNFASAFSIRTYPILAGLKLREHENSYIWPTQKLSGFMGR